MLIITLAQWPGYFSAAWLVERWGRKPTLVTYLLGSALAAWLLGNADGRAVLDATRALLTAAGLGWDARTVAVLCSGSLLSFFNLGAWGVVYTYTPEQYPTAIRGTGAGSAAAFGRLGPSSGRIWSPGSSAGGCRRRASSGCSWSSSCSLPPPSESRRRDARQDARATERRAGAAPGRPAAGRLPIRRPERRGGHRNPSREALRPQRLAL